jgi:hypothetical protein
MTRARGPIRPAPRRVLRDRRAGRILADLLGAYRGQQDIVALGLARGGIPVAWEPLEATSLWAAGETPETYPTGL